MTSLVNYIVDSLLNYLVKRFVNSLVSPPVNSLVNSLVISLVDSLMNSPVNFLALCSVGDIYANARCDPPTWWRRQRGRQTRREGSDGGTAEQRRGCRDRTAA